MERREIFIVIAVIAAVCVLITALRSGMEPDDSDLSSGTVSAPVLSEIRPQTSATNYWDKLHQQTETTAAVSTEPGVVQPELTQAPRQDSTEPAQTDVTGQPDSGQEPIFTAGMQSGVNTEPTSQSMQTAQTSSTTRLVIVVS